MKHKQIILESVFIGCAMGEIFRMAPYNKPRKTEIIIDDIHNYFVKYGETLLNSYHFIIDTDDRYALVEKIMQSSQAFKELNLSQHEYDLGVTLEDENRPKWACISRDTKLKDYYDFIDLDACIRNISMQLYWDWLDNELFEGRAEIKYVIVDSDASTIEGEK